MEDWLSWTFSRHHAEDKKDNPAQLRRRRREAFDCIVKHDYFCLCVWLLKLSACKCSWCPLDFWPHVFGLFLWLLAVGPGKKGFKKPCIWATNILFQNWFIKLEGPGWLKIHWGRPRQPVNCHCYLAKLTISNSHDSMGCALAGCVAVWQGWTWAIV